MRIDQAENAFVSSSWVKGKYEMIIKVYFFERMVMRDTGELACLIIVQIIL